MLVRNSVSLVCCLNPLSIQMWRELESHLLSTEIQIPVYFAFEDDQTLEVFDHTRRWAEGERDSSAAACEWHSLVPELHGLGMEL